MHTKSSGVATSFVDFAAFFLPLAVRSASGRKDIPYAFPIMKKNMYAGTYNNQKHNFTKRRKSMPKNKRESLIYTVLMCFTMVLWMSIYNVTLHMGALNLTTIREAWIGFPIAYVFAMCMDWFVVSGPAKGFAFRFLVKPESPVLHKVIAVSCSMVVPMVIIMSMYGALEGCVKSGNFNLLLSIWLTNIPKNFIMALPFQLLVAGPLVRRIFRGAFPEGTVLA